MLTVLAQHLQTVPSGSATGSFAWFSLGLLLWILASIIGPVVIWLTHRPAMGEQDGNGVCGNCGFSVRGLESLRCPECGADLRKAGITRRSGKALRLKINVYLGICLTLLAAFALVVFAGA